MMANSTRRRHHENAAGVASIELQDGLVVATFNEPPSSANEIDYHRKLALNGSSSPLYFGGLIKDSNSGDEDWRNSNGSLFTGNI